MTAIPALAKPWALQQVTMTRLGGWTKCPFFQGNGAPPCTISILESRHSPAQRRSFPLECDFYMRAHAGCFPLQGIVFLAAAIPCLTGLCSFNGSGLIRSLNSLLYPLCQNEWRLWKSFWDSLSRKRSCSKESDPAERLTSRVKNGQQQFPSESFLHPFPVLTQTFN